MNILYVVNADMERPTSGNSQRTRLIFDALCKLGEVYILDVRSQGESWRGRQFLRLLPQTGFKGFVNTVWDRMAIRPCRKCLVPMYPFPLRWSIDEYFPTVKFDIVVARYLFHVGITTLWNVAPKLYVDIDDYPMQIFDTMYAPQFSRRRKVVSRLLNALFVRLALRKTTGCWVANPEQICLVEPMCKCSLLRNIPFPAEREQGIPLALRKDMGYQEPFIFTVGKMNYPPNFRGIDVFLKTVWPHVLTRFPKMRYKIVGKGVPKKNQDSWAALPNVDILGFVDDLSPLYRNCITTVVPVMEGGGTCIKTLEALANSRTCISTPFGVRGIPKDILAEGANGVFVYNNPSEFVDILTRLTQDVGYRRKCEMAGKRRICEQYSSSQFESEVLDMLM